MKKIISYLLIISTILFLVGCSNDSNNTTGSGDEFPEGIPEELKTELTELKGFYEIDSNGRIIVDGLKLANAKLVDTWQLSEETINKIKEFEETNPEEYARSGADHIPDQLHFSSDGTGWEYVNKYKDEYKQYNMEGFPNKWIVEKYEYLFNSQIEAYGEEKTIREIKSSCSIRFIWPEGKETESGIELDWTKSNYRTGYFALLNNLSELIIAGNTFDTSLNYIKYTRQ